MVEIDILCLLSSTQEFKDKMVKNILPHLPISLKQPITELDNKIFSKKSFVVTCPLLLPGNTRFSW